MSVMGAPGRGVVIAAIALSAGLLMPARAYAETAYEAYCADNAVELERTMHESTLDPATWASDPKNLAKFGFNGPGDIDILYHLVIDKGAPYIESHWSNLSGRVEWTCGPE